MSKNKFLHLKHIEQDFDELQKNWKKINDSLHIGRDEFSDTVKNNLLATYDYVNFILDEMQGESIFKPEHIEKMLEINHRVLIWENSEKRREYHDHVMHTRNKFYSQIDAICSLVDKYEKKWIFKQEAAIFVAGVSQPQLFIEWNHRSHSTLVNIMSLQAGHNPFIINTENAKTFFDPAQEVKGSKKETLTEKLKLLKKKKIFEKFFEEHSSGRYVSHKKHHLD